LKAETDDESEIDDCQFAERSNKEIMEDFFIFLI